jgi:hypothetical protein
MEGRAVVLAHSFDHEMLSQEEEEETNHIADSYNRGKGLFSCFFFFFLLIYFLMKNKDLLRASLLLQLSHVCSAVFFSLFPNRSFHLISGRSSKQQSINLMN